MAHQVVAYVEEGKVPQSVLEAIKAGIWDFEPDKVETGNFDATEALPGTNEKLAVLADRVEAGLPLWHPSDRRTFEDRESR
jgi:hypothetical protein